MPKNQQDADERRFIQTYARLRNLYPSNHTLTTGTTNRKTSDKSSLPQK